MKKIVIAICLIVVFTGGLVMLVGIKINEKRDMLHTHPLPVMRKMHKTNIVAPGPASNTYDKSAPPSAEVVKYMSEGRELMAWILKPKVEGKRPAVLYAHGGNSLGLQDAKDALPFLNSGFVVMLPSWRAENGNKGNYEMCYGEVDDAMAALDYLAKRPDVDRSMLFAAGHSIGGTIVLLLAESTKKLKKAAACGALPAMNTFNGPYPDAPFEKTDLELGLRSAGEFVEQLSCPLMLFYSKDDPNDKAMKHIADTMMRKAKRKRMPEIKIVEIEGFDHFSALSQAIPHMVKFFSTN